MGTYLRYRASTGGYLVPEWSTPEGSFSLLFKKEQRQEAIEKFSSKIDE